METIGDAYMVVGGVPEVTPKHASLVANMALDMVIKSKEVYSPATGKPLQVITCTWRRELGLMGLLSLRLREHMIFTQYHIEITKVVVFRVN